MPSPIHPKRHREQNYLLPAVKNDTIYQESMIINVSTRAEEEHGQSFEVKICVLQNINEEMSILVMYFK
jgi:hypothetical protein